MQTGTWEEGTADRRLVQIAAIAHRLARREIRQDVLGDVADDVAQNVVLACLVRMRSGEWREPRSLGAMVRGMIRRRAIDLRRRDARRTKRDDLHARDAQLHLRAWMDPAQKMEEDALSVIQASILERVPSASRRAFMMVREERLPYGVVAERLGVSRAAVQFHVVKAQRWLREELLTCGIASPPPNAARMRKGAQVKAGRAAR